MDSRNKRASAIGIGLAFARVFPNPDGAIVQADRQQTAYCYAGILASGITTAQITFAAFAHETQSMEVSHDS